MEFVFKQPKQEHDIKCSRDCMIRALTIITQQPYSTIYKMLYEEGWRTDRESRGVHWTKQIENVLDKLKLQWYWESFPGIKGQRRITAKTFPYKTGNYILKVPKHVVAVIDGKYYDTWDSGDKCVYKALRIQ